MIVASVLIVAAGWAAAADKLAADPARVDRDKLQGTWSLVSVEANGEQSPQPNAGEEPKLKISGDRMILNDAVEVSFKLDAGANPRLIDVTLVKGDQKGVTFEGIYTLDGDDFKMCLFVKQGEKQRPSEFTTTSGSNLVVVVFKREKS